MTPNAASQQSTSPHFDSGNGSLNVFNNFKSKMEKSKSADQNVTTKDLSGPKRLKRFKRNRTQDSNTGSVEENQDRDTLTDVL